MSKKFGISDDRLKHMLGVARKSYEIAKNEYNLDEEKARQLFLLGFIHDIGYEFTEDPVKHPSEGFKILDSLIKDNFKDFNQAMLRHGNPDSLRKENIFDIILNKADMHVDYDGQDVSVKKRLDNVIMRFGKDSKQYKDSVKCCKILEILPKED